MTSNGGGGSGSAKAVLLSLSTVLLACADSSVQSDGDEESGSTMMTSTESESGDEADECPAPDPEFASYFFNLGHPGWPYTPYDGQLPPLEFGVCTVTSTEVLVDPHVGEFIDVQFDCLHGDGQHYPQRLVMLWSATHEAAIETWSTVEPLELRFMDSSIWDEHLRFKFVSVRDAADQLLFAGIHSTPPSIRGEWASLGTPPGDDFAAWFAPFSGFTLLDLGCGEVDVDASDYLGIANRVRRLGVGFELDNQLLTLHDKTSAVGVDGAGGRYDLFVGQAFEIIETDCGDCLPIYIYFHALRQPD